MLKSFWLGLFCCCGLALGQAYRADPLPTSTIGTNIPVGAYAPILAIPGAFISIDGTTYTDPTALTPCPQYAPVVLAGSFTCQSVSDAQGNFGFWLLPKVGTYNYTITLASGEVFGPFPLTSTGNPVIQGMNVPSNPCPPTASPQQVTTGQGGIYTCNPTTLMWQLLPPISSGLTGALPIANGGTGTATPTPGPGITGTFPNYATIYNGLDAFAPAFCSNPSAPTDACVTAAYMAGISNTVISSSGFSWNGVIDVPTNQNLTLRAGTYTFGDNGKLILEANGSLTCPDGPYATTLLIPATYAVTDQVITLAGGNAANQRIRGCKIEYFVPPSATSRADVIQYAAWAIGSAAGPQATGVVVEDLVITGAWNALRMNTGSSNGKNTFRHLQISSFNRMADIDNIFDTLTFDDVHWWPYDLTGPQYPAFYDPANIGIRSGHCDDLQVSNSLFIGGQGMSLYSGTGGVTTFTLNGVKFDTNAGITMSAGQGTMNGGYFSIGTPGIRAFVQSGGIFIASGVQWGIVTATVNGQAQISGNSQFYSSGGYYSTGANDVSMFTVSGDTAYVNVVGAQFLRVPDVAFVNPTVLSTGGARLSFVGNQLTDKGTGLGYFMTMPNDSHSMIAHNSLLGWSMAMPASFSSLNYSDNSNLGPSSTGQQSLSVLPFTCGSGLHAASMNGAGIVSCN